ncbi:MULTISPECIES: hypothetical protein [Methylomonas]|uniref:Uncharacterized protein n=1 Tax=Methylomonas koyamae TaxID=702114 RepID=A0A177PGL7_9GAMM|nr:hypothetical protein [Methylomonas koyamae]OAI29192.1 hypothetical protein A1355_16580 [Methylomonas koyamae]
MTVSSKTIPTDLLDALMSNYQSPEDLIGANDLLKQDLNPCCGRVSLKFSDGLRPLVVSYISTVSDRS